MASGAPQAALNGGDLALEPPTKNTYFEVKHMPISFCARGWTKGVASAGAIVCVNVYRNERVSQKKVARQEATAVCWAGNRWQLLEPILIDYVRCCGAA